MRFQITGATGEQLAKRMLKMAWDKSGVVGMVFLADRGPDMTEDQVWADRGGSKGEVYADYLFGRMMKLNFRYGADFIEASPSNWRSDYQSFCHTYKDIVVLVTAAAASLKCSVSTAEPANA